MKSQVKEKLLERQQELNKQLAKGHAARQRKGGMTKAEADQFAEAYREQEKMKKEIKKIEQDRTGKKNPLPRR